MRASSAAHQPALPLTGRRAVDRRRQCGPASVAIRRRSSGARPCCGSHPQSHGSSCSTPSTQPPRPPLSRPAVPGPRLGVIEGEAHDRLDPPAVPGKPLAQLVADAREDLQVIQRPRAVGRAQHEHPARAQEHERHPPRPDQDVALDHPAAGGRELASDALLGHDQPPTAVQHVGQAIDRAQRGGRDRQRRPGAGDANGRTRRRAVRRAPAPGGATNEPSAGLAAPGPRPARGRSRRPARRSPGQRPVAADARQARSRRCEG